jgi:hypothetical protein
VKPKLSEELKTGMQDGSNLEEKYKRGRNQSTKERVTVFLSVLPY